MMAPAPVVRIRGWLTASGARITLLTVRAPRGARIAVRCSGRRCPVRRWARTASLMRVPRFQRSFPAGTRIVISVTKRRAHRQAHDHRHPPRQGADPPGPLPDAGLEETRPVSRGVTVAQRLTRPDGAPTALARAGVAVLMAVAAAAGWAAGPDRDDPVERPRDVVAVYELSGDLPAPRAEPRPELGSAAALPAIRGADAQPPAPQPAATPSATTTPAASPEPTATPEITVVPVATPPSAPAPTAAPPAPAPTPAPTFDSSG